MSEIWHGQVIDRVVSPGTCRLDVWVFDLDRAVLIGANVDSAPEIGAVVRGETSDEAVVLQVVPEAAWPSGLTPLIPTRPGAESHLVVTRAELGDEPGDLAWDADGSNPRRM